MLLDLDVQGTPSYGKPVTISFSFRVDPNSGWTVPDTLITNAFVQSFTPNFELVSGDSAWVDTLYVGEVKTHSFVVRPLIQAEVYQCVVVTAFVEAGLTIGDNDCVLIDTCP